MSQTITVTLPDGYDPQNVLDFVNGDTRMWAMSRVQSAQAVQTESAVNDLTSSVAVIDESGAPIVSTIDETVSPAETPVETMQTPAETVQTPVDTAPVESVTPAE